MSESMKKPWVKMPVDEAKELSLLRARLLELASNENIDVQDKSLAEMLEDVMSDLYWEGVNAEAYGDD